MPSYKCVNLIIFKIISILIGLCCMIRSEIKEGCVLRSKHFGGTQFLHIVIFFSSSMFKLF